MKHLEDLHQESIHFIKRMKDTLPESEDKTTCLLYASKISQSILRLLMNEITNGKTNTDE
ncbi:hypothetical protein AMJ86_00675 [bacterium SM23_57]|nr:MAG: hypothetical protein AMJ86_00675 [bacterium SM23_57]